MMIKLPTYGDDTYVNPLHITYVKATGSEDNRYVEVGITRGGPLSIKCKNKEQAELTMVDIVDSIDRVVGGSA